MSLCLQMPAQCLLAPGRWREVSPGLGVQPPASFPRPLSPSTCLQNSSSASISSFSSSSSSSSSSPSKQPTASTVMKWSSSWPAISFSSVFSFPGWVRAQVSSGQPQCDTPSTSHPRELQSLRPCYEFGLEYTSTCCVALPKALYCSGPLSSEGAGVTSLALSLWPWDFTCSTNLRGVLK